MAPAPLAMDLVLAQAMPCGLLELSSTLLGQTKAKGVSLNVSQREIGLPTWQGAAFGFP